MRAFHVFRCGISGSQDLWPRSQNINGGMLFDVVNLDLMGIITTDVDIYRTLCRRTPSRTTGNIDGTLYLMIAFFRQNGLLYVLTSC